MYRPGAEANGDTDIQPTAQSVDYGFDDIDHPNGIIGDAEDPITEEDAWTVISANFQEKGLVRQQLDSFDMFMTTTMQVSCVLRRSAI